jgi:hypothetical protein
MKGTRHSEEQIITILKQGEAGLTTAELCRGPQAANAATTAGGYDGPAALPRVFVQTAIASTPAPGITIFVKPGESLQAALNHAKCGDTVWR